MSSSTATIQRHQSIVSPKIKTGVNLTFNGVASGLNLMTALSGNLGLFDSFQENLETSSSFVSKFATAAQGLINSVIAFEKRNLIAFLGALAELPIAIFSQGKNLFLSRGLSAGLNHFDSIISRTKMRKDEKVVVDEKGNPQFYDDFRAGNIFSDFTTSVKTIGKEIPNYIKSLYKNPLERDELFPRSFFACSSFMILGSLFGFAGFEKVGSAIRHTFGGLAGIALATDQSKLTNERNKDAKEIKKPIISNYAMSGLLWVIAAIPDLFKHYDFFSNRIKNSTEIALCLDRLAGMFFIFGNQRLGEE